MLSECLKKAIFSGQETREKRPETEMGNNCIFPNYVDSKPQFLLPFPFPEQPNTMATASGDWVRLLFKGGGGKREEASPLSLSGRHVVELLSCHEDTPHILPSPASTDAQTETRPPSPASASLCTIYTSISLLPATCQRGHQSLSVCLAGRINGPSLEQVLTLLQRTRMQPPNRNLVFHR